MGQIRPLHTREEWNKVRKLADKWYAQIDWHIPTKVYYFIGTISFIVALFSYEYRLWAVIVTAIAVAQIYSREKQIQSYVEGWQQGQDYVTGEYSIDELLEYDKKAKKDTSK